MRVSWGAVGGSFLRVLRGSLRETGGTGTGKGVLGTFGDGGDILEIPNLPPICLSAAEAKISPSAANLLY